MPITQDRMLALLTAAQDYQQAWKKAQGFFGSIQEAVGQGRLALPEAWDQVQLLLSSNLQLQTPIQTTETLTREATHFRLMHYRNTKSAEWQREAREKKRLGIVAPRERKEKKHRATPLPNPYTKNAASTTSPILKLHNTPDPDAEIASQELFDSAPADQPVEYTPGQLTEEQKKQIEDEMAEQDAKRELERLLGGQGRDETEAEKK